MLDTYRTWTDDPGPLVIKPEPWMREALCAQTDPELFFPDNTRNSRQAAEAKKVCHACTVRAECLIWALENGEDTGVLGGLTEKERQQIKSVESPRTRVRATGRAWSPDEESRLVELAGEAPDFQMIADALGRTASAVRTRLFELRNPT